MNGRVAGGLRVGCGAGSARTGLTRNPVSVELYRRRAAGYDASAQYTMPLRLRTIGLLSLRPGDVVVDAGAGTGLSFAPLLERIGERGRVLAFEQCPEMFELAEARVRREGWVGRVWLQCAAAEDVRLPQAGNAVLFNYVHDICRSAVAVHNLLAQLEPRARIAIAGMKFFPWWTGPLNLLPWLKNIRYNASPADLWRPWDRVAPQCDEFELRSTHWGMGYMAWGRLSARAAGHGFPRAPAGAPGAQ